MDSFIETLAPFAQKHGKAYNILPSLIIAQGIHETGGGTSELAQKANNLFGIKKGIGWEGEVHEVVTHEYRKVAGMDEKYFVTAEFRKYDSLEGAVIDLCEKYTTMSRYSAVPGNYVFPKVAQAVKDAGYATDPTYPEKLIRTYSNYDLGRFDTEFATEIIENIVEDLEDVLDIIKEDADMAFKVVVDAGHGRYTPGKRSPAGEREWFFNNTVALALIAELKKYEGVEILRVDDPTGNTDVPLNTRTARANAFGGDIYVSIHHNANSGKWGTWTGVETYVYTNTVDSDGSMRLAKEVHPRLVRAMGLKDRGIKKANFAVIRDTRMPAILTEGGYMDSTIDITRMRNKTILTNAGISIAEAVAAYGKLKAKVGAATPAPTPVNNPNLFYVRRLWSDEGSQIGAFSVVDNARDLADRNITFNVYNYKGEVVYNPREAKAAAIEAERKKAEEAAKAAEKAREEEAKAKAAAEAAAKKEAEHLAKLEEMKEAKAKYDAEFAKAIELGITDGTNPHDAPTREQVAVMIVRALNLNK